MGPGTKRAVGKAPHSAWIFGCGVTAVGSRPLQPTQLGCFFNLTVNGPVLNAFWIYLRRFVGFANI